MTPPPPLNHAPAPTTVSWWQRNWKWFVPVAGVGGLTLVGGGLALIVSLFLGLMKKAEPYQTALAQATASADVQDALGTPIKVGFFLTGKIELNSADGVAALSIPISGPRGDGTINVRATKTSGHWKYSRVVVTIAADRREIDLTAVANQPVKDAH